MSSDEQPRATPMTNQWWLRGWQTRQEYEQSRRAVEAKLAAGRRLDGSPDERALKARREDKHDD